MTALSFSVLPGSWGIARLAPDSAVPEWAFSGAFTSVSRSADELSIVCADAAIPESARAVRGWAALKLVGPFSFDEIGVLSSVAQPLAQEQVSLFAVSTFDTDYILVRHESLARALGALEAAGHRLEK